MYTYIITNKRSNKLEVIVPVSETYENKELKWTPNRGEKYWWSGSDGSVDWCYHNRRDICLVQELDY